MFWRSGFISQEIIRYQNWALLCSWQHASWREFLSPRARDCGMAARGPKPIGIWRIKTDSCSFSLRSCFTFQLQIVSTWSFPTQSDFFLLHATTMATKQSGWLFTWQVSGALSLEVTLVTFVLTLWGTRECCPLALQHLHSLALPGELGQACSSCNHSAGPVLSRIS